MSGLPIDFAPGLPADGYAWWYLDALADDGRHGLTVIFFIGSVFSPHYARARRRGPTPPVAHCAVNAILYGPTRRWAFSEYGAQVLRQSTTQLAIGQSAMRWDGARLRVDLRERCTPLPWALRGELAFEPTTLLDRRVALDAAGRHQWQPIAPHGRLDLRLANPPLRWQGDAYFDTNHGVRPLETDFQDWHWSRSHGGGDTHLYYDLHGVDGSRRAHALQITAGGICEDVASPPVCALPSTPLWRMPRVTRADGGKAEIIATWEDTPFYARSLIASEIGGVRRTAVHESLSLRRFVNPLVQRMLPFRLRRVGAR